MAKIGSLIAYPITQFLTKIYPDDMFVSRISQLNLGQPIPVGILVQKLMSRLKVWHKWAEGKQEIYTLNMSKK